MPSEPSALEQDGRAPLARMLEPGAIVADRYRVESLLGEGGMGAVYLVEHVHMKKRLALKVLSTEMGRNDEAVARFEQEARAAAHVEHPNVAAAVDFGRMSDGAFYLALEYVEGVSLRQRIQQGPLDPVRAVEIIVQALAGLSKAHEMGIVHRDLKPDNVMISQRGGTEVVKVLDFGIAKIRAEADNVPRKVQATRAGMIFGTPDYMSPEQALGEAVDGRADLYAIGVMLYEMLTGVLPFQVDDPMVMLARHITAPPPKMSEQVPHVAVPPALEAVVMKLLEKKAADRYRNADELADALRTAVGLEPRSVDFGSRPSLSGEPVSVQDARAPSRPLALGATAMVSASTEALHVLSPEQFLGRAPPRPAITAFVERTFGKDWKDKLRDPVRRKELAKTAVEKLKTDRRWQISAGGVFALVLLLIVGSVVFKKETRSAINATRTIVTKALPVPLGPTDAELRAASIEGVKALEALAVRFPEDKRVAHELVRALAAAGDPAEAMRVYGRLLKLDSEAADDTELQGYLIAALEGPPAASAAAMALLEGPMGEQGIDLLLENANRAGPAKAKINQALAKPSVREHASSAAKVVLDLREAGTCEAKHSLLPAATKNGDKRALVILKAIPTGKCGFFGLNECNPCLRKDNQLRDAISAIESRVRSEGPNP
jgi:serine/threonine-protein kinase